MFIIQNNNTSHPKDETIMVKCLAQGHKRRDQPGRDSNPHSDNTRTWMQPWMQRTRPLGHDPPPYVYVIHKPLLVILTNIKHTRYNVDDGINHPLKYFFLRCYRLNKINECWNKYEQSNCIFTIFSSTKRWNSVVVETVFETSHLCWNNETIRFKSSLTSIIIESTYLTLNMNKILGCFKVQVGWKKSILWGNWVSKRSHRDPDH